MSFDPDTVSHSMGARQHVPQPAPQRVRTRGHFRIDEKKYQRHIELFRGRMLEAATLLEAIGSVQPVIQAIHQSAAAGQLEKCLAENMEGILTGVVTEFCAVPLVQPTPCAEPNQKVLHGLLEHLREAVELMRFSKFVIPPGGEPEK